jgi:hypothetical protein
VRKPLIALAVVLVLSALFGLCLVSALQLLFPRDMPFGVTGPSPVVDAVQSEFSLDLVTYSSEADLSQAAERGDIYGGYIPGSSSDTLVTVPAKSFFAEVHVRGGFAEAAKKASRTFTTRVIAPLPTADRTGDVSNLSRPDPTGPDQIDAEHQATDLALGAYALAWEASNLSLRDRNGAKFRASVRPSDGPSAPRPPRPIAPV